MLRMSGHIFLTDSRQYTLDSDISSYLIILHRLVYFYNSLRFKLTGIRAVPKGHLLFSFGCVQGGHHNVRVLTHQAFNRPNWSAGVEVELATGVKLPSGGRTKVYVT